MRCIVTPCVGVWIETHTSGQQQLVSYVTPCVGVWIETAAVLAIFIVLSSHPAWVCGLKPSWARVTSIYPPVTPCVGVWIETKSIHCSCSERIVTPCVGVWIETLELIKSKYPTASHPAWVCGLKHSSADHNQPLFQSHPAWVCGLKQ